jgi:type II secretory pathway component GspD/PulD (secretin)
MNEKTFELRNIIRSVRQQGSTTYLLDAAINNPNVTIIVANQTQAKEMEEQYRERLQNLSWWKKIIRIFKSNSKPKFVPVRNGKELMSGNRTPVIIDLYAIASSL